MARKRSSSKMGEDVAVLKNDLKYVKDNMDKGFDKIEKSLTEIKSGMDELKTAKTEHDGEIDGLKKGVEELKVKVENVDITRFAKILGSIVLLVVAVSAAVAKGFNIW